VGISLTSDLITWLSTAKASVDIDQYLYLDADDEESG
jgi:hypothetical protein